MTVLVAEQTKEWSEMLERQLQEEHDLNKAHILQQNSTVTKLLEEAHQSQLKELETKQDR